MKRTYVIPAVKTMSAVTMYQVLAVSSDMTVGAQDLDIFGGPFGGDDPGVAM